MRVWVVSDVHTDYKQNLKWCEDLSQTAYKHDTLILAGDVSDDLPTLRKTLRVLAQRWAHVFFVPGNHDLWVRKAEKDLYDSIGKLAAVRVVCAEEGVHTEPACVCGVWVVPLLSWYHATWDVEHDIPGALPAHKMLVDFHACRWPSPELNANDTSLAAYFDAMNDAPLQPLISVLQKQRAEATAADHPRSQTAIDAVASALAGAQQPAIGAAASADLQGASAAAVGSDGRQSHQQPADVQQDCGREMRGLSAGLKQQVRAARDRHRPPIITFSHFLPHQVLLPEKRLLRHPNLAKAVGSDPLAARIAGLRPDVHCFGHTHFSWDTTLADGTRYVQWPLAYPAERRDRANGGEGWLPLLIWDSAAGGPMPRTRTYWGSLYDCQPRDPDNIQPAPWCYTRG